MSASFLTVGGARGFGGKARIRPPAEPSFDIRRHVGWRGSVVLGEHPRSREAGLETMPRILPQQGPGESDGQKGTCYHVPVVRVQWNERLFDTGSDDIGAGGVSSIPGDKIPLRGGARNPGPHVEVEP
jgi:hypothetical protein